jgi:hypothetical protein
MLVGPVEAGSSVVVAVTVGLPPAWTADGLSESATDAIAIPGAAAATTTPTTTPNPPRLSTEPTVTWQSTSLFV